MRGDSSPPDDVRDIFHETRDRWRARWHAWMSVPPAEWPRAVRWGLAGAAWAIGLALAWSVWWLVGLPARATLQKDLAVAQQTLDRANEAARRLPILMQTLRHAQAQAAAWRRLLPAAGAGPRVRRYLVVVVSRPGHGVGINPSRHGFPPHFD